MNYFPSISRRAFLKSATAGSAMTLMSSFSVTRLAAEEEATTSAGPPKRLAAVNTVYRHNSHADHICGRFIHGYPINGKFHRPAFRLVRIYNHQYPEIDISRSVARRHKIELADTVADALGGKGGLDVDAVLLIGEHGEYPSNELGQKLYPRYELFNEIVAVFKKSGRAVPVFNDKHLSYDHRKAAKMVETARQLKFGLMAGSSLPVTWRQPELELPLETPIAESLSCYGGSVEAYFFHGLETLQCMHERRKGGETGVRRVRCLSGDAVWKAGESGEWSEALLKHALARSPSRDLGKLRNNCTEPYAILIDYQDGTRGSVLNLKDHISDFNFACRVAGKDKIPSCCFFLPEPPGAKYFDALSYNIEKHFLAGRPPYPIERTLLTTTILDLAMHSLHDSGRPIESPALSIRYRAPADSGFFRGRYTEAG